MAISDRRMRTRASLRTAAMTVCARTGIVGASIEEIADEAGLTRGAFYSNYSSKDELILDIVEQLHSSVAADARTLLEATGPQARESAPASRTPVTQEEKQAILSEILGHFRFPFSHTAAALITYREISVHALRSPTLLARMNDMVHVHEAQLHAVIEALLLSHGARLLIDVRDLVAICTGSYQIAADEAVAARAAQSPPADSAEHIEVDTGRLLAVLTAFVRFPGESPGAEPAPH